LKEAINEILKNRSNKNIRDINEFRKGYRPRTNIVKDENGDLLADFHNILNKWENYFCHVWNVLGVDYVREIDMHTAEPLVPEPNCLHIATAIEQLKRYESPGIDQISAELVEVVGNTLCFEFLKLINYIWIKKEPAF
jgi:hypothetical protein